MKKVVVKKCFKCQSPMALKCILKNNDGVYSYSNSNAIYSSIWRWVCPNLPQGCFYTEAYDGKYAENGEPICLTTMESEANNALVKVAQNLTRKRKQAPYREPEFSAYGNDLEWILTVESFA